MERFNRFRGGVAALSLLASLPAFESRAQAAVSPETPIATDSLRGPTTHAPSNESMLNDVLMELEQVRTRCMALPQGTLASLPSLNADESKEFRQLYGQAVGFLSFPEENHSTEEIGALVMKLRHFLSLAESDLQSCESASQ